MKPSLPIWSSRKTMRKSPKRNLVPVSLTVSLVVMLRGGAQDTSCVCALSFPGEVATSCGMHHRRLKCCSFKYMLLVLHWQHCSLVVHSTKGSKTFLFDTEMSLGMRLNPINWLSSSATLFCEAAASHGNRPSFTEPILLHRSLSLCYNSVNRQTDLHQPTQLLRKLNL